MVVDSKYSVTELGEENSTKVLAQNVGDVVACFDEVKHDDACLNQLTSQEVAHFDVLGCLAKRGFAVHDLHGCLVVAVLVACPFDFETEFFEKLTEALEVDGRLGCGDDFATARRELNDRLQE